jgi:hypothetical protein
MQYIKNEVIATIKDNFLEEGIFELMNSGGGIEGTLTMEEVTDAVNNCTSRSELANLVLHEWMFNDVFGSLDEFIGEDNDGN